MITTIHTETGIIMCEVTVGTLSSGEAVIHLDDDYFPHGHPYLDPKDEEEELLDTDELNEDELDYETEWNTEEE